MTIVEFIEELQKVKDQSSHVYANKARFASGDIQFPYKVTSIVECVGAIVIVFEE